MNIPRAPHMGVAQDQDPGIASLLESEGTAPRAERARCDSRQVPVARPPIPGMVPVEFPCDATDGGYMIMSRTALESALRILLHMRNVHDQRRAQVRALIRQDIEKLKNRRASTD